jgi:hypothetical protein
MNDGDESVCFAEMCWHLPRGTGKAEGHQVSHQYTDIRNGWLNLITRCRNIKIL